MRIGFVTDDYHPRVDGVVSYIDTMRKALEDRGHKVFVVCPKYPNYREGDGRVIRVSSYDPLPFSSLTSRMIITNRKTIKAIEKLNLDIIHSHTQSGSNFAAFKAAKTLNLPLVSTMHTTYHPLIDVYPFVSTASAVSSSFLAWRYYRDHRALRTMLWPATTRHEYVKRQLEKYIKYVLDNSDLVITNSDHTKKYVNSFGSDTKTVKVPNGVDRSLFTPAKQKKKDHTVFALTSRISGEKRQIIVLKALKKLKDKRKDCQVVLIGDGPERKSCEKYIEANGLKDRVRITGEVSPEEVRSELARADFGILASYRFDTDPLSLKEYLCMGMPVIYCDDNFKQMFSHGGGNLCARSADGFAKAIEKFIELGDKEKKQLSEEAYRSAEYHDVSKPAKLLEEQYESLLKLD